MKKIAFILSRLLLLLAVAATALPATAYDFMEGGLAYKINSDGNSVTVTCVQYFNNDFGEPQPTYTNASGSLAIPSTVTHSGKTYSVTSIGDYAFSNCSGFTGSLTIPNSVTSIGYSAFQRCSGFTGSLTIPNSVTSIGYSAFSGCSGFSGSLNIPNSVTSIAKYAFAGCSGFTGSLTIPESVTSIGGSAFSGCSGFTGSLTIPKSVTSIGEFAFEDCSGLTSVNIKDLAAWCKISFSGPQGNPLYYVNTLYLNGTEVEDLVIPNSVTAIASYAFYGCRGLTSLTIPNSVTSIGQYAFRSCFYLTGSLNIPNSVTSIGHYAFQLCFGLTQLELGSGLKDIGSGAFSGCSSIAHIICHRDRPAVIADESAFKTSIYSTATVHVPKGSLPIYYAAPVWMKFDNFTDDAAVEEAVRGDLNGDGVVDIDDLNVLVNIMLDKE